jgi:Cd2+/Zn2+-exporting ATPase
MTMPRQTTFVADHLESEADEVHATSGTRASILLAIAGALAVGAEVAAWGGLEPSWPVIGLSLAAIGLGGLRTMQKGLFALRTLTLNINFLMSVAVLGAFAIGEYPEAAVVIVLFEVAELLESRAMTRARKAVQSLMAQTPQVATIRDAAGAWVERPIDQVAAGMVVLVRPGERIPLDGVVESGESAVNQAPITGESVPIDKRPGDQVFAGTINESGALEFTAKGGRDDTTIARIIRTVQEAQSERAPTQRFIDQFARFYTPTVCGLAFAMFLVPWLVFSQPYYPWLYRSLVLLVIACPCALVISTPVTIVTGLAAGAKRGILIKGGVYLEQGRLLEVVALDKTGTITVGKPVLTDVVTMEGQTRDGVLQIAGSLDALSDHPVARAVAAAWPTDRRPVEAFKSLAGRGVEGTIGGEPYVVGNHRLAEERGVCGAAVEAALTRFEGEGKTAVVVANSERVLGVLAVADQPRESSIGAIRTLHRLGLETIMLSGDNQTTADAVGRHVGVQVARGNLLPEHKLRAIDELRAQRGAACVGMVGDGVNDAPALAKASIGFAMGAAGTDTALETADVALMGDDLRGLPEFIELSRRTHRILQQNIAFALGMKAIVFVAAITGHATLWLAVLADVGASLAVVANGLRVASRPHPRGEQC